LKPYVDRKLKIVDIDNLQAYGFGHLARFFAVDGRWLIFHELPQNNSPAQPEPLADLSDIPFP